MSDKHTDDEYIAELQARLEVAEKDRHDFACGYRQTSEALIAARARIAELEMPVTDEEVTNVLRALDTAEDTNDPRRVSGLLFRTAPELKELLTRLSRHSQSPTLSWWRPRRRCDN